jgi:hypothetical protein
MSHPPFVVRIEETRIVSVHLGDESCWEAKLHFKGAVLASHNNCRAIVPGDRQFDENGILSLTCRSSGRFYSRTDTLKNDIEGIFHAYWLQFFERAWKGHRPSPQSSVGR